VERRSWLVSELHKQEHAERDSLNDDHSNERGAESGAIGVVAGDLFRHSVVEFKE
jgi:hypothetical protein